MGYCGLDKTTAWTIAFFGATFSLQFCYLSYFSSVITPDTIIWRLFVFIHKNYNKSVDGDKSLTDMISPIIPICVLHDLRILWDTWEYFSFMMFGFCPPHWTLMQLPWKQLHIRCWWEPSLPSQGQFLSVVLLLIKKRQWAACFGKTMNTRLMRGACLVFLLPCNPEANSGIFHSDMS